MPMGLPSSFKQLPYDCQFITPPLICFCSTQIIRMLIVVLPKSQFVRSIARTHGLPPSPSNSTTTCAASDAVEPDKLKEPVKPPPHRISLRHACHIRRQPPQADCSMLHDQQRQPRQRLASCDRQVDVFCYRPG